MSLLLRSWPARPSAGAYHRWYSSFQQGDFCILRHVKTNRRYFIGPLEEQGHKNVQGGTIYHRDVLGAPVRAIMRTDKNNTGYMAHFPTLEEYVLLAPRACTPIYPSDASAIVQMLDLAPGHRVLEAGTGNGSLTLHLARAVAGDGWIDTVDKRLPHSRAAEKHLERFERGKYRPLVNFHLGALTDVAASLHSQRYDAIVLDMPDPSPELASVLPLLHNDRFLVCYLPNMTQVLHLMQTLQSLPLVMEDCIETEWKHWDIRPTVIRQPKHIADGEPAAAIPESDKPNDQDDPSAPRSSPSDVAEPSDNGTSGQQTWVCRPKNFDVHGHTAFLVKLRKCAPAYETTQ
ncbi:S-adenosyl-L-methionine-dependent methyltransferase [Hesseltinella vesiculosa]|uniref:tRNA (adenine(58)-N(1))-methyltransferase catalytic subunit TRM61 n=1 Tax=Hesseltinella vesiculosa TaxID=101127 RepID=A0A1X2GAD7_9FUNG|nr:S-adenosyl-L-methionine-dependent methyltransferase [Hesseltinella vesiculosa]